MALGLKEEIMKYTYTLEIATDGEVWFTRSSIKSLQEAEINCTILIKYMNTV